MRQQQLLLKRQGATVGSIPCEDIGVILVDHPGTTYSHAALASLADADATLVVCGPDHLPSAMLMPLSDHSQIVWRLNEQINVSKPIRKQLWKQIVQAKIRAQAENITRESPVRNKLISLAAGMRSGDPRNVEAQAAKAYWQAFLPEECFRRDKNATGLNGMLNYGYAVLRAAVARALVGAGLLPALGIHHRHRSNAFCLADDLMEPFRPLVDDRARELYRQGYENLTQEAKAELLKVLSDPVSLDSESGPLMVSLHRMTASLVKCYQGEVKKLAIPTAMPGESRDPESTIVGSD